MEYVSVSNSLSSRNLIPANEDPYKHVNQNKDAYKSIFYYNQDHYNAWSRTGSLAGMTGQVTDRLVWDFDSKENIDKAHADAKELCNRLVAQGVNAHDIQVAWSGMKGFSVEVLTKSRFTVDEFRSINLKLAEGLDTNDSKILDSQRIFRMLGTKHSGSGLYKFPLTISQLFELPLDEIKSLAADINNAEDVTWHAVDLPPAIITLKETAQERETEPELVDTAELDFKFKPKGFSNCKYAIMHGMFPAGNRNNCLMALGATCRAQGYPKEIAYNILKGAARLQGRRYGTEPYSKNEIWNNIIETVYRPTWKGAQYSCKNQPWLKEVCDALGSSKCRHDATPTGIVEIHDMSEEFEKYSVEIEKNTIKTGLRILDEKVPLTIGMPVALLGAPGSGKTSLSLNILNNTSKAGIDSVFFSMDMYGPLVYMKQIQKMEGLSSAEIHHIFKHDVRKKLEIKAKLKEEYKNVRFSLKSGHTVQDMRDIINDHQETTGRKVKLVLIDYLECIAGPYSDSTANSAKIAGELRDFATEMAICGITLVQPPKSAGDASYPLDSMRQVKGSSMLEQSFRAILSIYREGFGPNNPDDDKFLTIGCLKNTMGELFKQDYYWSGKRGEIWDIDEDGERELSALRNRKASTKKESNEF